MQIFQVMAREKKRGSSSINGVVTIIAIDVGKCVDLRIMTKKYTACSNGKSRQGTPEYELFMVEHDCSINHFGDSDSKSYPDIVAAGPYAGVVVEKGECIDWTC